MTLSVLTTRWRTSSLSEALAQVWASSAATSHARGALTLHVDAVAEVDSTNTQLLSAVRDDAQPSLRLLVAERQSAGRGRLGRPWHSTVGESLTFSISMPMPAAMGSELSLALGAAIADALDAEPSGVLPPHSIWPQLTLKWPNDVWLRDDAAAMGGRKLAGVLIETTSTAWGRALVIGVGINVRPPSTPLVPAPPYGVASLVELHASVDAVAALHALAPALVHTVLRADSADAAHWFDRWQRRDALRGRRIQASGAGVAVHGIACGLRHDGALLVQHDDGTLHALTSGEVSVRVQTQ